MPTKIVIIDYGMGNLQSIRKKLLNLNVEPIISSNPKDIEEADKLILPGVGHFKKALENLNKLNIRPTIDEQVLEKQKPILGICLGMQLMTKSSEEGNVNGFGWFDAEVLKFDLVDKLRYKVPHVGWNKITPQFDSDLMKNILDGAEFYFVHSYYVKTKDKNHVLNTTTYEKDFVSALENKNIFGVQYHPEKSHETGDQLMKNFVKL